MLTNNTAPAPLPQSRENALYLAHEQAETRVLGPGLRYAIWVQGCLRACKGCIFPEGRSTTENGYWASIFDLIKRIMSVPSLRGLTISGGEPFLQAGAVRRLAESLKARSSLDIMIYSGYTIEELQEWHDPNVDAILKKVDLLVDGEYREELNTNSLYRGSDNQRIHFLSPRYLPWRERILQTKNRNLEFVNGKDGLFLTGLPPKNFQKDFFISALGE